MGVFFNPNNGEIGWASENPYITNGDDGITYFRMKSPDDGSLWDLHIDSTGAWVSSPVTPPSDMGVMIATGPMFGLTYAS